MFYLRKYSIDLIYYTIQFVYLTKLIMAHNYVYFDNIYLLKLGFFN